MTTDISLNKINKLAIPALIAGISEPILSLTDAAVIGNVNLNPTESLAAIGIVTTFISMLIWVLGQTRSAISSIISQHLGANTLDKVRQLPAQAIFLITALSIFIIVITYPFASNIFKLYNAENIILDYSVEYYRIRVIGFPFTLFVIAVFGTFRGLQNTFYPMVIAITGAALNVILDFLLVYGIDGVFEGLHIKGAAYASVIAQLIMAVIAGFLLLTKTSIPLRFTLPFNPQIKNFTLMILNLFVRTLALNITLYFATKYATGYGKNYIAAYTIAINLWFLGAFIIDGYASAGNILSGKLLGEKNYNTLIASLFYYQIGTIFTKEQAVLEKFYSVFWIVLAMQPLCALAFIFDGMYKGLGKMKVLRNVLLLSTFLVFIPILWITDHYNLKLHGIFIAFTLWIIARGIPLIIIFRKQFLPLTQNN